MKASIALTAVWIVLSLAGSEARGLEEKEKEKETRDGRDTRVVLRSVALQPVPDSEVEFDEIALDFMSDGSRLLRIRITASDEESRTERVHYIVDPETETYKTVRGEIRPEDVAKRTLLLKDPPEPNLPPDPGECCDNLCNGNGTASIDTVDPIACVLTTTAAYGSWQNADRMPMSGCRWVVSGSKSCYAANPSCAGTHWSINPGTCQLLGPYTGYFFFLETASGGYFNWDFLNPSVRTDVSQSATVQFDSGFVSFAFSHGDSGEGASFLSGTVHHSYFNTCYP